MPSRPTPWTKQEICVLSIAYKEGLSLKVIASALNRTLSATNHMLRRTGSRGHKRRKNLSISAFKVLNPSHRAQERRMGEILKSHGLSERDPKRSEAFLQTQGSYSESLRQRYTLQLQIENLEKNARTSGEEVLYTNGRMVEKWAQLHQISFVKAENGAQYVPHTYVIKGLSHTPSQFLLVVNRQRISRGLLPFHVGEWEDLILS